MITTKKNIKNSIYLPLFVSSFVESCLDPEILVKKSKNEEKHFYKNKTKFCVFMYSNCMEKYSGIVNRKNFFHMLNNIKKVDNLGKCYNKKVCRNSSIAYFSGVEAQIPCWSYCLKFSTCWFLM